MQKLKGHCFTRTNCEIRCWLEVFCMLDIVKLKTIQYSTVANSVSNILVFSRRIYRTRSGLNSVEPLATQKQYITEIMLLMVQIIKGHTVNAALILKKVWCYREAASIRFQTTESWKDKSRWPFYKVQPESGATNWGWMWASWSAQAAPSTFSPIGLRLTFTFYGFAQTTDTGKLNNA